MDNNRLAYELLNQKHFTLLSQHKPHVENYNSYIYSICIFSFDVEVGQVLEVTWPPNALNENSLKNITGLSFPESNSLCEEGELNFCFKFRKSM